VNFIQAIILGIVEGLTEFLPVSSTGHLTIVEQLMKLPIADAGITAFTAVIQVGAILALILYFRSDLARLLTAWFAGLTNHDARHNPDYRLTWYIVWGSLPILVIGFITRHLVDGPLRNLWIVVFALIAWSFVMIAAERASARDRGIDDVRVKDTFIIGLYQCIALVPGVSRSGATISGGLFRNLDRVTATRISFLLSIPAMLAAGGFESLTKFHDISHSVGWSKTLLAMIISFVVGYACIAWLLRLVAAHKITVFVWYRFALAIVVAALLVTGTLQAS